MTVNQMIHWALTRMSRVDFAQMFNDLSTEKLEIISDVANAKLGERKAGSIRPCDIYGLGNAGGKAHVLSEELTLCSRGIPFAKIRGIYTYNQVMKLTSLYELCKEMILQDAEA